MLPTNPPPWELVFRQAQRWIGAGRVEAMVHDPREILRLAVGRSCLHANYRRLPGVRTAAGERPPGTERTDQRQR
jgi:hypothetical protein